MGNGKARAMVWHTVTFVNFYLFQEKYPGEIIWDTFITGERGKRWGNENHLTK